MVVFISFHNCSVYADTIAQRAKISVADDLVVEVGPGKAKMQQPVAQDLSFLFTYPFWAPLP